MTQYSRQVQTQAQQQVQTLSPQQILVVKLLELPTLELEERIHSELLDNPALEEGKEPSEDHEDHEDNFATDEDGEPNSDYGEDLSLGDYRTEDDIPDYKLQENNRSKGETPEEIPFSDNVSFYETLKEQLDMQNLTPEEKQLGEYLIGSLDDDGLLRKSTESLIDELAIYQGIYTSPEQLEHVLSIIQDFDPAGIGARSLQECLLVQVFRILPVHAEFQAEPVNVCAEFIYASLDFPRLQSLTSTSIALFSPYIRRQFRIGSFFTFLFWHKKTGSRTFTRAGFRCFSFSIRIVFKTQSSFFSSSLSMRSNTMS